MASQAAVYASDPMQVASAQNQIRSGTTNTNLAQLGAIQSIASLATIPLNTMNAMDAYGTQAKNAAASASALTAERTNVLRSYDRETRQLAANQTVSYIMSGLESTGTVTATQEATAREREADRASIWQNYQTAIDNAYRAEKAAKKAKKNAFIGGAAQMAGTAISLAAVFSDERLKQNLIKVGKSNNGLNIWLGRYTKESGLDDGKLHLFLIAQEVQKIRPQAVKVMDNGYLAVDYANALL